MAVMMMRKGGNKEGNRYQGEGKGRRKGEEMKSRGRTERKGEEGKERKANDQSLEGAGFDSEER